MEIAVMMPPDNTYLGAIKPVLESWSGYADIRDVMQMYPSVDIYLAGGLLRDVLMEHVSITKDVDLFVKGEKLERFLDALSQRGRMVQGPFGSPRWHPAGNESHYADIIPIRKFDNGLWTCDDIVDVLNQFDFTANAVAIDIKTGDFYDPQNGVRDIRQRIMKAVRFDYPEQTFKETFSITRPAVVWFRILHYAALLGLEIEPLTSAWIRDNRAYTRYRDEFEELFFPLRNDCLEIVS